MMMNREAREELYDPHREIKVGDKVIHLNFSGPAKVIKKYGDGSYVYVKDLTGKRHLIAKHELRLYDPKKQRKGSWLDFVKAHKNMRTAKGLLDLKAISKLWKGQKALDPKIIGYGKDKQWNKQLRATAQAKRSTQGQTKLTGGASTSRRLSDYFYDPKKSKGQAGIKAWLKKQGIEPDTVDVEGQYDSNISYSENIKNFKNMLKIDASSKQAPKIPACANVSQLKAEIKDATEKAGIPDLKAELKDEKTKCDCTQMGLYDPAPRKSSAPPKTWFAAMYTGIKNRSDVRNPGAIVKNIWAKLTPAKRSIINAQAKKGHKFKYDLPLPDDRATRGTGTLRMVKPFKLAEVQVNLKLSDYLAALKSGLFSKMKRNDGTVALVARCKSQNKNCNIFVDKVT